MVYFPIPLSSPARPFSITKLLFLHNSISLLPNVFVLEESCDCLYNDNPRFSTIIEASLVLIVSVILQKLSRS